MDQSEGCHSFWGVDWDCNIPDPTNKTSWRIQVGNWKTYDNPKDYQTSQFLDNIVEETQGQTIAVWAGENAKLQAARRNRGIYEVLTDDKDYFKVIADARLKLETNNARAWLCTQAIVTSIDASEEPSDSENKGAHGKVKRQHMDHIAENGYVGRLHCGLVHKPVFYSGSCEDTRSQSQRRKMEQIPDNSQRDVKKVRPKPEVVRQAKKGGKNSSLREFDGPLSLEERRTCETPPEIQGPSCALGETTSKTKKDTEQFEQSKVLQNLSWQRQSSWTPSQSSLVWLKEHVMQFPRTLWSKWPKLPDCYDCHKMNACIWEELDDQIYYGQLILWNDQ